MKITTISVQGFEGAIIGMRNPMKSRYLSDSGWIADGFEIGERDMQLCRTLIKNGSEHAKFLRQIQVWADFNMPRYFWQEFDQYHFHTTNSESTMHKLLGKEEITVRDFVVNAQVADVISSIVDELNFLRKNFLYTTDVDHKAQLLRSAKMILPESYLQMRTVNVNYAELYNIYKQRRHHRLKEEWQNTFCAWCESLPYFKEFFLEV